MAIDFTFEKGKKFKFAASCKDLDQVLSRVNNVMGASSSQTKSYFIIGKGKKVAVLAFNQDTFCAVVVPNAVPESDGAFGFSPVMLQGVIKGRAEMDFDFTGTELLFKLSKGKYSGNIITLPVTSEQISFIASKFAASSKKGEGKDSALSRDMLDTLKEGMVLTAVKDLYTQQDLASYIVFTEKQIMVSAFDQHHFALYKKKLKGSTLNFRVALPINHFNIIDRMVEDTGKDTKFILRPDAIRVEGSSFMLSLPATQSKDENFELVQTFMKANSNMPYRFTYVHEKLATLVDNLFTLKAVNANFEIEYKKDALKVTFSTQSGSASESFIIKKEKAESDSKKINIDPELLRDLIRLVKGQTDTQLCIASKVLVLESKAKSGATLSLASALVK